MVKTAAEAMARGNPRRKQATRPEAAETAAPAAAVAARGGDNGTAGFPAYFTLL
jgi:hypothetical protein